MYSSTAFPDTRKVGRLPKIQSRGSQFAMAVIMALSIGSAPLPATATLFQHVVLFGDSLSDMGNVFTVTEALTDAIPVSPPYFDGRFSDGPVWVETLAQRLRLNVEASLQGGRNFAYGGAEISADSREIFQQDIGELIPSLRTQVERFLAEDFLSDIVNSTSLYILWGGANDLRDTLLDEGADPLAQAQSAARDLAEALRDLADAGATYFLVPNLPNLGRTPESLVRGSAFIGRATSASMAFNETLRTALDAVEAERNIAIIRLDVFTYLEDIIAAPERFGFTNVTAPCLPGGPFEGGTACASPATYLFWDEIHPTTVVHTLLAGLAIEALPALVATQGDNNPARVDVSVPERNVPVLHVQLGTGEEAVQLSSITVRFTGQQGPAALIQTLQVRAIHDTNGNGTFDAGEPVLATEVVSGVVDMLTLDVAPPFPIAAQSSASLLVTLDINSPGGATSAARASRTRQASGLPQAGYLVSLLPIFAAIGGAWRRCRSSRRWWKHGMLLLCCILLLASCNSLGIEDDEDDVGANELAFTAIIPAQGIQAVGTTVGPFTAPPVQITGAEVRVE